MDVEQSRLPNGIRVLTSRMPGFEAAAVVVFVRTGSRAETRANGGVAHFLEHMAFKGTTRRTALQISTEIECLGANVNAFTSKEMTAYFVGGLRRTIPQAVEILGDVLTASTLDAEHMESERRVILQEIRQYQDNPGSLAGQALWDLAYPDQALGRPILGEADIIAGMQRDDVAGFVQRNYTGDRIVVVGAADIAHDVFHDLVAAHFSSMPAQGVPDVIEPARYVGGTRTLAQERFQQVTMLLGFPSVPEPDPRAHAHSLLGAALGSGLSSPLFQEVRQKRGLAYAINASGERGSDFGMMNVYAGTTPEHVPELLALIRSEFERATTTIGDQDMMRARNQALARLATITESPFRIAQTIAWGLFTRGVVTTPATLMAEVEQVTPDDLKRAAGEMLAGSTALALVGPIGEIEI